MAEGHSHNHGDGTVREEIPIFYRSGEMDLPGFLVKVGTSYFFEDNDHGHVRVHLWRIRGAINESA